MEEQPEQLPETTMVTFMVTPEEKGYLRDGVEQLVEELKEVVVESENGPMFEGAPATVEEANEQISAFMDDLVGAKARLNLFKRILRLLGGMVT